MGLLATIFSAGASSLIDAVGDAIDKNFTTDEERLEQENEMARAEMDYHLEQQRLGIKEKELVLADTANARDNQSRIQESKHASWLSKNVLPMLAVFIIGLTFGMYFWIIESGGDVLKDESDMKDILIYILGALTTLSTQVVAYFFGSSQGSKDKTDVLASLRKR